jgi:hypothetical protein
MLKYFNCNKCACSNFVKRDQNKSNNSSCLLCDHEKNDHKLHKLNIDSKQFVLPLTNKEKFKMTVDIE